MGIAERWLSVRLDFLGAVIVGLAAAFATNVAISITASATASATDFASYAGLSLSYSMSLTGLLNWVVRSFAQMEAGMNATERVLHYTEEIAQEAPAKSKDMGKEDTMKKISTIAKKNHRHRALLLRQRVVLRFRKKIGL